MSKGRDWSRIGKLLRMCGSDSDAEVFASLKALRKEVGVWNEWCGEVLPVEGPSRSFKQGTRKASSGYPPGMDEVDSELVTDELLDRLRASRLARQADLAEIYQASLAGGCHFDPTFRRTNPWHRRG